jgi:hypothetical protein
VITVEAGQFFLDLEALIREALDARFKNVGEADRFRIKNRKRRMCLRHQAHMLGLNFVLEVARVQKDVIAKKKELEG